ncbi:hypothetical protein WKH56_08785 [Priestia sp. SB1]|uniref:Uncharacterized protein n=1 Tax=Priestia aryabhattai TaxID=412384 RepID=A0AAX6NDF7_PRIAR|nr:hypothetical protein [Priestia aryabhattai]MDU9693963.1 hypothetical protein [Priestia aryabhattai]
MFKDVNYLTNKRYLVDLLKRCNEWHIGESENFTYRHWNLTLKKEEPNYAPFAFSLEGVNTNGTSTCSRRYYNPNKAILHILNEFNENANSKNRYNSIEEFLIS